MNPVNKRFADLCRMKRNELGLTQGGVEEITGIDRSHIARLETKRNGVYLETAIKLAVALGLSLDELKKEV